MDRAQFSNLAGGHRSTISWLLASGLKAHELLEAKKKLIAAFGESKNHSTYWKQADGSFSQRNKSGLWRFFSTTGHHVHD
jgi:hypothetical protein